MFRSLGWKALIGIGLILYFIGLCFGPYKEILNLPQIPYPYKIEFNTRWGPFEGTLYLAIGYAISVTKARIRAVSAWALIGLGVLTQFAEMYLIWLHGDSFGAHDYLLGTIPLGIGTFAMCNTLTLSPAISKLSDFGPVTLGAYCIHLAIIKFIKLYIYCDVGWITLPVILFVFIISIMLSSWFSQLRYVRKLFR